MEIDEKLWIGDRKLWKTVYVGVNESYYNAATFRRQDFSSTNYTGIIFAIS